MTHKYDAKPVWYDASRDLSFPRLAITPTEAKKEGWLYFPSTLEYETFRAVRAWFMARRMPCIIDTQHTIEILPKTESIKAITWRVDFMVKYSLRSDDGYCHILYVEAKGLELDDYKLKMNLLCRFKPEIMANVRVIRTARTVDSILSNTIEKKRR